jgi:hypothetical protein
MFELLRCQFDTTELVSLSNQIRRSVWNLMRYQVDESTMVPAAAAMVVCACSFQTFRDLVNMCVLLIYSFHACTKWSVVGYRKGG